MTQAKFVITIPAPTKSTASANKRSPLYVSTGSQSISIVVTPPGGSSTPEPAQVFALTPGTNCTGTPLTCTLSIDAPVGSDTFAFTIYSGAAASGSVLSTGSVLQTISSGTANTVTVTLGGVPSTLTLALVCTPTPCDPTLPKSVLQGTPETLTFAVTAKDASGATIGADTYSNPISLTLAAGTVLGLPSGPFNAPNANVTVQYDGTNVDAGPSPSDPGYHESVTATYGTGPGAVTSNAVTIVTFPKNGWTPNSLPAGEVAAWYDASNSANFVTSGSGGVGSFITTWKDSSGNGNDLTVPGPTAAPTAAPTIPPVPTPTPTAGPTGATPSPAPTASPTPTATPFFVSPPELDSGGFGPNTQSVMFSDDGAKANTSSLASATGFPISPANPAYTVLVVSDAVGTNVLLVGGGIALPEPPANPGSAHCQSHIFWLDNNSIDSNVLELFAGDTGIAGGAVNSAWDPGTVGHSYLAEGTYDGSTKTASVYLQASAPATGTFSTSNCSNGNSWSGVNTDPSIVLNANGGAAGVGNVDQLSFSEGGNAPQTGEVIILNKVESAVEQQLLRTYLNQKWTVLNLGPNFQ